MKMKYNRIVGPITLTEQYSKKYNKRLYIFGDLHKIDSHCPKNTKKSISIEPFIEETLKQNQDKTIDFFLERDYIQEGVENPREIELYEQSKTSNYIFRINDYFRNCFKVSKKECQFENTRFHYSDIRTLDNTYLNNIVKLLRQFEIVSTLLPKSEEEMEIEFLRQILVYFNNLTEDTQYVASMRKNFDDICMETKIIKQICNIDDINLSAELYMYFENEYDLLRCDTILNSSLAKLVYNKSKFLSMSRIETNYDDISLSDIEYEITDFIPKKWIKKPAFQWIGHLIQTIHKMLSSKTINKKKLLIEYERLFKTFDLLFGFIIEGFSIFMDFYIVSRIFRSFKDAVTPSHIIIYAGNSHSENIRTLLDRLDFELVNEAISNDVEQNDFQCIDIRMFKQPFFH